MIRRAFSLLEVLITISALGVLASIAYVMVGDVVAKSREQKIVSDTENINRAVKVYLASGGSLDDVLSPGAVLKKLKSAVSAANADRMTGMTSSVIDSRVSFEPADGTTGIVWDPGKKQFVEGTGKEAIKRFTLDDSIAEEAPDEDDRSALMKYSASSSWIWDFQESANPGGLPGPTVVAVTSVPAAPIPAAVLVSPTTTPTSPPEPATPIPAVALDPPVYSTPGGNYSISNYDMMVSLSDPNPAGVSKLAYSIDFGPWLDYTAPIAIQPESTISVQSIPLLSEWDASVKVDQFYNATPITLNPPAIDTDRDSFGLFYDTTITVTLSNSNSTSDSKIRYRLEGGDWTDYADSFRLDRSSYPNGVTVEAQTVSTGSPYYLVSSVTSRTLSTESLDLSGNTSGSFHDPVGQVNMVTNLAPGASSSYFEWGNTNHPTLDLARSYLDFSGGGFSGVDEGERFQLGSLTYYNGTILADSGADTIDFDINLSLDINGNVFNPYFDFSFDLVNTRNLQDPNNPWPDADFVYLSDARASRTLIVNDTEFEFRLEFGETSADGFSTFDEFHVLEKKDASVTLYGTFVEIGPVAPLSSGTDSPLLGGSLSSLEQASYGGLTVDSSNALVANQETGNPIAYQKEGYIDAEEGSVIIFNDLSGLKEVASNAADSAEQQALTVERLITETSDKIAQNDQIGAAEKVERAQEAAISAAGDRQNAADAAERAKELASEADSLARLDPSAEDEAQTAVEQAVLVIDEFERAASAAQRAEDGAAYAASLANSSDPAIAPVILP